VIGEKKLLCINSFSVLPKCATPGAGKDAMISYCAASIFSLPCFVLWENLKFACMMSWRGYRNWVFGAGNSVWCHWVSTVFTLKQGEQA